jgi:exodeoxyribonuclease V alpha subunit
MAPLHPGGTARGLFLGAAAGPEPDDPLPRGLWEALRARDVDPGSLLGAWEVGRWVAGAAAEVRRGLVPLVVALGEAVESGSSYLPLRARAARPDGDAAVERDLSDDQRDGADEPGGSDEGLEACLDRLGLPARERGAALTLAATLTRDAAPGALADLFGGPGARRVFVVDGARLYPEAAWTFEARLAAALRPRLSEPCHPIGLAVEGALTALQAHGTSAGPEAGPRTERPPPSDEQLAAVRACLTQQVTLVTGGPGSGKTSIIVSLLRALRHLEIRPEEIAVAAPTGRAAHRIEETLQRAGLDLGAGWAGVATIHRLLGLRGALRPTLEAELPEHHAGWRLPHRIVVCDEASMIDLFMMTELLSALRDDAHLVLLGDVDQLPSVRLGAAFRDLCLALPTLTSRLTASHRMNPTEAAGAEILTVAAAVRAGARGLVSTLPSRARAGDLVFSGVEHLSGARLPELLERWYAELLGGDAAFAAVGARSLTVDDEGGLTLDEDAAAVATALERHRSVRLLCVTRAADHAASAAVVNERLHRRVRRAQQLSDESTNDDGGRRLLGLDLDATATEEAAAAALGLCPGEPVTVLRNDYERELWNGDQGLVVRVAATPTRAATRGVAFARGDGLVVHLLDEVADNVALAFALTVHKSQGSEFQQVALVLPAVDGPLLSREIIYTAMTRARRGVIVVGDARLLAIGIARRLRRASGLAAKLRAADG